MNLAHAYSRRARDGVGFVLGAEVFASDLRGMVGPRLNLDIDGTIVTLMRGEIRSPRHGAAITVYTLPGEQPGPDVIVAAWLEFISRGQVTR
jgi:hypothetical protein